MNNHSNNPPGRTGMDRNLLPGTDLSLSRTERPVRNASEDLQAQLRTLAVNSPEPASNHMPSFHLANAVQQEAGSPDSRSSEHSLQGSPYSTTNSHNYGSIGSGRRRSSNHSQASSLSNPSQNGERQMPLPIGTERQLGLIERQQTRLLYPAPQDDSGGIWASPPRLPAHRTPERGMLPSPAPASRRYTGQVFRIENPPRHGRNSPGTVYTFHQLTNTHANTSQHHYHQSAVAPGATTLSPAYYSPDNAASMDQWRTSVMSSSSDSDYAQSVPRVEDNNLSEFVSTPGFGGYRHYSGASQSEYLTREHQHMHPPPSSTTFNGVTNGAYQYPDTQTRRRQDFPTSAVHRGSDRGQVSGFSEHQGGRRISQSYNEYSPVREVTDRPSYSVEIYNPSAQRIDTSSSGRQLISLTTPRRMGWDNTGSHPSNWVPGLGQTPPDPVAFAPGDWICRQLRCDYHNFQRNSECRACGHPRPVEIVLQTHVSTGGPPLGSAGDWRCECGFINWRRRALCRNCYPDHPSNQDRPAITLPSNDRQQAAALGTASINYYLDSMSSRNGSDSSQHRGSADQQENPDWTATGPHGRQSRF